MGSNIDVVMAILDAKEVSYPIDEGSERQTYLSRAEVRM